MPYIIQTDHLTKTIGGKELVKDVGIHVKKGEIYGFLGPNGAGKTTVMKMITNLWKPTQGSIELFGEELTPKSYEVLTRMGSIIEFPIFYDKINTESRLLLDFSRVGGFFVTNLLLVQCLILVPLYFYVCKPVHLFPPICAP